MGTAQHLAVAGRAVAALAPRGNMVGVHLVEVIDARLVRVVPDGAQRAVGFALGFHFGRLLVVSDALGLLVEDPDGQQFLVGRTAERPT